MVLGRKVAISFLAVFVQDEFLQVTRAHAARYGAGLLVAADFSSLT